MKELKRSDMAGISFSFRNSLHHIHNTLTGLSFEEVHEYFGDLYDHALEDYDYWRERAEQEGEFVPNMNHISEMEIVKSFSEANETEYTIEEAYSEFIDIGKEYLEALDMIRESMPNNIQSDIDSIYSFWDNEILYKSEQVLKGLRT
jgi:DNA-binding ferritin-like protein